MPRPSKSFFLALLLLAMVAAPPLLAGEAWRATLFFPDREGGLARETRVLDAGPEPRERALALMEALAEGPERDNLVRPLPHDAEVRSLFLLPGGMVVVDLAGGPFEAGAFGAVRELGCVRALVFTLTRNLPGAASVRLLKDGGEADTLAGHIGVGEPLEPRDVFSGEVR